MENLMGLTNILEKETVKLGGDWASDVQMRDTDFKDDSQISGLSNGWIIVPYSENRKTGFKQVWGTIRSQFGHDGSITKADNNGYPVGQIVPMAFRGHSYRFSLSSLEQYQKVRESVIGLVLQYTLEQCIEENTVNQ